MNLAGMEIFARVVEEKSFSGAARRLNLSKSVVSKHVSQLEKSMGVQLLNRTTRSVSLTEVGREFYARCADIVLAAEQAELSAAHSQTAPRGTLRFTSPVSFGTLHVAPALPDLLASCSDLGIEMVLTNRAVNLVEEGYDVSIVIGDELQPGFVARKIAAVKRLLCAAPSYLRRHGTPTSPQQLTGHNCLVFTGLGLGQGPRWQFSSPSGADVVEVSGNLRVNNLDALRRAALRGAGIAALPTYLVGNDMACGDLVTLLPDHPLPGGAIYAVFPANRYLSPKVRAFVDFLIARFGSVPGWEVTDAPPPRPENDMAPGAPTIEPVPSAQPVTTVLERG